MTRTHPLAATLTVAAALAAAAPAFAGAQAIWGGDEKVTVTVHYSDADLRNPAGAMRLAERIRLAARRVCGGDDPVVAVGVRFPACQHRAIDRALATIDAPLLADALGRPGNPALATR